ncbi:hypothetical protein [Bartonella massiliensis]|uniref:hypothetical protein n=1 Tax=Bartonella massiliensis TaxID=929795 RepID=UPI00163BD676|nr:hypothetical protein [Bartonella massiliensis]
MLQVLLAGIFCCQYIIKAVLFSVNFGGEKIDKRENRQDERDKENVEILIV